MGGVVVALGRLDGFFRRFFPDNFLPRLPTARTLVAHRAFGFPVARNAAGLDRGRPIHPTYLLVGDVGALRALRR